MMSGTYNAARLEECFLCDGYKKATVYKKGLFVYYKFIENEVYALAVYDYNSCGIRTIEQLTECSRSIKASFYHQSSTEKVNLLQIFCVREGEDARDLCYGYDESWIFKTDSHRLVIFENQRGEFLNVRSLIEQMDNTSEKKRSMIMAGNVPVSTIFLIAVNIIMFLIVELTGSSMSSEHMLEWGAMRPDLFFGDRQYYRIITEMFLHFGIGHLLNNMIVLLVIGKTLEHYSGHLMFLGYYMASGITAGTASLLYYSSIGKDVVSAGASGAIFGIVGVMFFLVLVNRGRLEGFTIKQLAMFIVLSIYTGISDPSVDFMAHAGGFTGGFLMALFTAAGSQTEKKY